MNLVNRIRQRIAAEGFAKTVLYGFCVLFDGMWNFTYELFIDLRYSGKILRGNHKTAYAKWGAHDVYHTDYTAMSLIFKDVRITSHDVLVDVGCGKGRVINYWLSSGYRNKMVGLELDPDVAVQTAAQFKKWPNVKIMAGDAIHNLPPEGTIFYFYNPFSKSKVFQFQERMLELFPNKKVTIIYYRPQSLDVFRNDHWNVTLFDFEKDLGIKRWGRLNKYHQLAIITRNITRQKDFSIPSKKNMFVPRR
jgi:SAM-dependent methyltransferase